MPGERDKAVELRPDGWKRFERAVDAAVKGGPKAPTFKARSQARKEKGRLRAALKRYQGEKCSKEHSHLTRCKRDREPSGTRGHRAGFAWLGRDTHAC